MRKKYFGLLLFWVSGFLLHAQISIDSALSLYKANFPQEKVLLQIDRNVYTSGETVWLKSWCMLDGQPSYLSSIIYVDLIDEHGTVLSKKMYKTDSLNSSPGNIELPAELKSGPYLVRAYTLWMLNFPEFIAKKNIFIYASDYRTYAKEKSKKPEISMFFFPEGGNLVAGVDNKVAFKIVDQNGYPIKINGTISNDKEVVTEFSTLHDGMGFFTITPEANKVYHSNIKVSGGASLQFKLPLPVEGISLKVDNSNNNRISVFIKRTETVAAVYNKVKLVAQIDGKLVYGQMLNLNEGQFVASISKKNMPPGILQITLFSENDLPLAERLAFISNYSIVSPAFVNEQVNVTKRALNKLSFSIPNNRSSLLIKVTDATSDCDTCIDNDNILSQLLLTSDLKGYINNPGYYFKDKSIETLSHLDLLLMTHGWRRFDWKKILANQFKQIKHPVESSLNISGMVTKSDRTEIVKNGYVSFIIKTSDSTTILADAKLTDKGEFTLNDVNFKKKASVAYMGTNENKKTYIVDVKIYPSYFDSLNKTTDQPYLNLDTIDLNNAKNGLAAFLADRLKNIDTTGLNYLGNVTVTAKKMSPEDSLNKHFAEGPFLMGRGINPAEYKNYRTIWQIIQAAVPGVTISGDPFNPDVSFNRYQALNAFSDNTASGSDETPGVVMESNGIAYFLNGQNVFKDIINTISVDDVAFIKVLKHEASVLGAAQGAIAIYTKDGVNIGANPYDKTFSKFEKNGYSLVKEFYNVDYNLSPNENKNIIDNRNLLLWNAKPIIGKDGKYHLKFFNNDYSKKIKISVQGIDVNGSVILGQQVIQ
ncbi:MAG: hypothetical protein J0I09_02450 [Sphingobacteriia bacterium]|nr:hypothetical protein [Sphingobacteriia bacterium]